MADKKEKKEKKKLDKYKDLNKNSFKSSLKRLNAFYSSAKEKKSAA
jgi:hypothetical protein